MLQSLIIFAIVFGTLVFIHELGHYYFAKRAGVLVREFAVGFGPKLLRHRKGETAYTLRLLPLGGYVMMAGYEEEEAIRPGMMLTAILDQDQRITEMHLGTSDVFSQVSAVPLEVTDCDLMDTLTLSGYVAGDKETLKTFNVSETAVVVEDTGDVTQIAPRNRRFNKAPVLDRILINIAGPFNNFILAIVLFILVALAQGGAPATSTSHPIVGEVMENSPAAVAQLVKGDRITMIDGVRIETIQETSEMITSHPEQSLTLEVERDHTLKTVEITPERIEMDNGTAIGQIGITYAKQSGVVAMILFGFTQTWQVIQQLAEALVGLVTGQLEANQLGGPVAIFQVTGNVAKASGVIGVLSLAAMLSANLGFFNLLPIPGLDGGKLMLNTIEILRGKPISQEKEVMITLIGAALLIGLGIFVTWQDIQHLF